MSVGIARNSIDLPGLRLAKIDLAMTDLTVTTASSELEYPSIQLDGEEIDYDYTFYDGQLNFSDRIAGGEVVRNVCKGRSFSDDFFGTNKVESESNFNKIKRTVSLLLPSGHAAHLIIDAGVGDVYIADLKEAYMISVIAQAGTIALYGVEAEDISLTSMCGEIEITDISCKKIVSAKTISGDISASDSDALAWDLRTLKGKVIVNNSIGEVNATSMAGRLYIS